MQTNDQVAGEAREKLAEFFSGMREHAISTDRSHVVVPLSPEQAGTIIDALRTRPERSAEEMKLRAEIACRDLVDYYREAAEAHLSARNASKAEQAIAWADGAMACGKAIRALPLHPAKDEGGGR